MIGIAVFSLGRIISSQEPTIAMVSPLAAKQPSLAALSQPSANLETITFPSSAYFFPNSYAFAYPSLSALRAPMIATALPRSMILRFQADVLRPVLHCLSSSIVQNNPCPEWRLSLYPLFPAYRV